jgi:hypothetical protein
VDSVIGLFIKIPFHAQLLSAEPALAEELSEAVEEAIRTFAATRQATDESFLLTFDEESRPSWLRAAEAARSLSSKISSLGSRLHGWNLLLDTGAKSSEESYRLAKRLWFGIKGDGFYISIRSKAYFEDYFQFGPAGGEGGDLEGRGCIPVLDAIYARPALPFSEQMGEVAEDAPLQTVDRLVDALGELGVGLDTETALAVIGPGGSPSLCLEAALAKLYSDASRRFLRLAASTVENAPYGPIASAFAALVSPQRGVAGPGSLLSGAERGLLEELSPMLDFLRRSPYRSGYSPQIHIRLGLCAAAALGLYARTMRKDGLPAFVILERIEAFPAQSLDLIRSLVADRLSGEGIMILAAGSDFPPSWNVRKPRVIEAAGPGLPAVAQAAMRAAEAMRASDSSAALAFAASGDPLRLRLAIRLLACGRNVSAAAATESLASDVLATLPREYAELLLALRLGEGVLTDDSMESFLRDAGYVPGIRSIVYRTLSELGFITTGDRPRIASAAAVGRCEEAMPDRGAAMRESFAARLMALRDEGLIIPSTSLYRRLRSTTARGAAVDSQSLALLLDCFSADAVYGTCEPAPRESDKTSLEPMADFLAGYAASNRGASLEALERLETAARSAPDQGGEGKIAVAAAELARAAFEYADGRAPIAASRAKNALMGLHALGVRKSEAKAHRLLGLCALAQEQVQEGADYLSNAYDIASVLPEPLECILSATAEAAADFTLGDLGRANERAEAAASWSTSSFRADWESICAFIKGRAAFEIGRYKLAEESFGLVRSVARVYSQAEASRRAEIWTGRAAAFAGEAIRAREILSRFGADPEALWFLAELEAWEGASAGAMSLADEALAIAPQRGFSPADAFDWGSGFSSLEGRAVGFYGKRSYLRDQIEAFREFAAGMSDPERKGIACAERLASLAREDRLSALHPAAHQYLFYRYLILERATPSSMEGASALSKAFKALQLRSARMGETLKDGFLEANRWNRALLEAARARKLI